MSCARVGSPTGGAKDTTPPELISTFPADRSVNFTATEITFTFNEYVKLNNVQQQLVVSPALDELPEFRIKKRSIVMVLKNGLAPNTTYNFNFGDAIVDVNENNPLKNFSYVVSTGDFIDSLVIRGFVQNAFTGQAQKEFTTMLYDTSAVDSTPYLKKPLYLSKTTGSGEFIVRNVKAGNYRVLAMNDVNKDYKLQATEEIGFADSLVSASNDSTSGMLLRSFKETPQKTSIGNKKYEDQRKLTVGLTRTCDSCVLTEPIGQQVIYKQWKDIENDTIVAQLRAVSDLDSITFYLIDGSEVVDTLQYYPSKTKKRIDAARKPMALASIPLADVSEGIRFVFEEPIINIKEARPVIVMKADSSIFNARLIEDSVTIGRYLFDFPAVAEEKYTIYWPDSNYVGLYGAISGADTMKVEVQKMEFYGNLSFNIDNKQKRPLILLFTDTKAAKVRSILLMPGMNKIEFKQLPPSVFNLAVIVDENGNGKWDTGNYLSKKQPELVINYKDPVQVRSNWDLELDWVLDDLEIK